MLSLCFFLYLSIYSFISSFIISLKLPLLMISEFHLIYCIGLATNSLIHFANFFHKNVTFRFLRSKKTRECDAARRGEIKNALVSKNMMLSLQVKSDQIIVSVIS